MEGPFSRNRLLIPGQCDKCSNDIIRGGSSFFVYQCHKHVECTKCRTEKDKEETEASEGDCPFCNASGEPVNEAQTSTFRSKFLSVDVDDEDAIKEHPHSPITSKWIRELSKEDNEAIAAETFDQLPGGAKMVDPSPVRTPLFVDTTIGSIVLEMSKETGFRRFSCWNTSVKDHVVIGGLDNTLAVFAADGTHTVHTLPSSQVIQGGVSISDEKSIICATNPEGVFTVNLNPNSTESKELRPLHEMQVNFPVCVFPVSKFRYGVLCMHPTRIEIFLLKDIFLDEKPQSVETLPLDLPHPDALDRACLHVLDLICVSSYKDGVLYMFNLKGEKVGTLCRKEDSVFIKRKKNVSHPRSVQCIADGSILVTCEAGDVHRVHNIKVSMAIRDGRMEVRSRIGGTWENNKEKSFRTMLKATGLRNIAQSGVFSETKYWMVDKRYVKIFNNEST